MRKLIVLLLLAVIAVSGCVNWGGSKATFGISEMTSNPDVYTKVESSAEEVKSGRYIQLQFTVQNKGSVPLENITIRAYDQCLFTGENTKNISEVKSNMTNMWNWKWLAEDTDFETPCEIKFRTTYDTTAETSSTINVLTETEYYTREEQGTLVDVPVHTAITDSSLFMLLELSEVQPFMTNEEIYAYINYEDIGPGMLKQLNKGDVVISVPTNLKGSCTGYKKTSETEYALDTTLSFTNKKAPSTTCKFKTNASQVIDAGVLRITASYKYQFDNSLLLNVNPK